MYSVKGIEIYVFPYIESASNKGRMVNDQVRHVLKTITCYINNMKSILFQ